MWRIEVYRDSTRLFYMRHDKGFSLTEDEDEATLVHKDHVGYAVTRILDVYDDIYYVEAGMITDEGVTQYV